MAASVQMRFDGLKQALHPGVSFVVILKVQQVPRALVAGPSLELDCEQLQQRFSDWVDGSDISIASIRPNPFLGSLGGTPSTLRGTPENVITLAASPPFAQELADLPLER